MILGLTGKNGAGKGEIAKVLQEAGFVYHSLSDVLREELKKQGKEITRKNLTEFANELRAAKGGGCLAFFISQRLEPDHNYIIDSIRHPEEVEVLRRCNHFYLLEVEADPKIRFERIRLRAREADTLSYEKFVGQEALEAQGKKPTDQQLNRTVEMADATVENNGTLEELAQKTRQIVQTLAMEAKRPDWDSYFIAIAKQVALRSNCIKRKVAAILVKDKRIISTGYNGTPRGIKNCNEGGCPRCQKFGPSGADLEACYCSHAEENAIVQAAYHGVSIKDASLYSTFSPCLACTKMIINAGIQEVIYSKAYPMEDKTSKLLKEAGISLRQWENLQ